MNKSILKEKNIYFPVYLITIAKKNNLNLNEFLLLSYFWDEINAKFDITVISNVLKISINEIMEAFNSLLSKNLISLENTLDENNKRSEYISLEKMYNIIDEGLKEEVKKSEEKDIYSIFETEFGRPISSFEYEIIRAWIEKGYSEELVLGALKEAVYNGVSSLRYIDKILYEWQKKGYKTMKEVNSQNRRDLQETKELFDYNWLDENE